jgi:hypothetical protein
VTDNYIIPKLVALLCLMGFLAVPAAGLPIANCNASFVCIIPENILMQFPASFGFAISGDVVLRETDGVTVSDVFRIFNDLVDTGNGTGLGTTFFFYSSDDSTPLPSPATYSANVTFITENPSGETVFSANGDTYLFNTPEPATFGLFLVSLLLAAAVARKRPKSAPPGGRSGYSRIAQKLS